MEKGASKQGAGEAADGEVARGVGGRVVDLVAEFLEAEGEAGGAGLVLGADVERDLEVEDAVAAHFGEDGRGDGDFVLDFLGGVVVFLEEEEGPEFAFQAVCEDLAEAFEAAAALFEFAGDGAWG